MTSGTEGEPTNAGLIAELLDRHAAALELYASQWTTTPADCVQEAFISFAKLSQPPNHVAAWLYQVVRNQALNAARSQRRRQHHERIAAQLIDQSAANIFAESEQQQLVEALDDLPAADREIVVLRIWSELTWQEIADLTNTSSSSAHRQYVAALTKLRQHLEPSCLPKTT